MKKWLLIVGFFLVIAEAYTQKQNDFYRHEFKLGIGAFPLFPGENDGDYGLGYYDRWKSLDLLDHDCYGDLYTTGVVSMSYGYSFWRWLQLGINVSYIRYWRSYLAGKESCSYTTFMPFLHFHWFNRPKVSMYSGMALGVDIVRKKDSGIPKDKSETATGLQFTFFGISVGRRLFGFAEIGVGNLGTVRGGLGYRF